MKNILVVSYSIIAALIGAGFASGQEILCYFTSFNKYGIIGIITVAIFFTFFIYTVLKICIKYNPDTYDNFLCIFKSKKTKNLIKFITLLFAFAVYSAMISAFSEIIYDIFSLPRPVGALLCTVISAAIFSFGTDRIFMFNGFLGLVLVFAIVLSCLYMLCYREFHVFSNQYSKPLESGLIYSGYNLVSITPVIITLSKKLKSKNDIIAVSVSTGIITCIIMTLVFGLISIYQGKIELGPLPMLTIAKRQNHGFAVAYGLILSVAIITTLFSSGGAIVDALNLKGKVINVFFISFSAFALSGIGFANLIGTAYKICGIIGFFVCLAIVISSEKYFLKK